MISSRLKVASGKGEFSLLTLRTTKNGEDSMRNLVKSTNSILVLLMFARLGLGQDTGNISGEVTVKGFKNAANAVIYIDGSGDQIQIAEQKTAVMDQKNFTFIPHVLPVQAGTTVEFLNSDAELHNVFTPDEVADKFNLGSWPQGQKRSYRFKKPGSVVLLCNVHPEMEGWIVVLPTPYFAKTGQDGMFSIETVPPGEYSLKIWHEKLKGKPQTVTVTAGETTRVSFTLTK